MRSARLRSVRRPGRSPSDVSVYDAVKACNEKGPGVSAEAFPMFASRDDQFATAAAFCFGTAAESCLGGKAASVFVPRRSSSAVWSWMSSLVSGGT